MSNYMYDKKFLKDLDNYQHKEKYARITALTLDEKPIEMIEGKVTGGSINIDGASALRRTSSLTLLAYDAKVTDYYWGLSNKYKLEIGLKNVINPNYPDIIWFKMGIYSIISFSTSISGGNYNISISGKDKMCQLNGELGGVFPFSVDLGTEEFVEKQKILNDNEYDPSEYVYTIKKLTLPYIIQEMIHMYGGEPYHNIIINDLDTNGLELMEYKSQDPMYLVTLKSRPDIKMVSLNGNQTCYVKDYPTVNTFAAVAELQETEGVTIYFTENQDSTSECSLEKYEYGKTIGYKITDLTYTGDLIVNVGETITSVLDKFVNMLGEFEYFYDLDGRFIFQKKKTYIQTAWSPIVQDNNGVNDFYIEPTTESSKIAYTFVDNYLVTSISNSPKLDNIKNDFSIWGTRKSVTKQELDVHMRYAIHSKPHEYCSIAISEEDVEDFIKLYPEFKDMKPQESCLYVLRGLTEQEDKDKVKQVGDWRELIYLMARDYNKYGHFDNFEDRVAAANPILYPAGRTSYEQYYIDMLGFWRQLYNPHALDELKENWIKNYPNIHKHYMAIEGTTDEAKLETLNTLITAILNTEEIDKTNAQKKDLVKYERLREYGEERLKAQQNYVLDQTKKNYGWTKTSPEMLNFWIDFLDPAGELEKYSISAIGSRPKANTDKDVKALYFREAPEIIYYYPSESSITKNKKSGYTYIQLRADMTNLISLSAQGKSAKDTLDKWLNEHLYGAESISLSAIPVYYLEPNTRIKISNQDTNLSGEYIVNKISLPLTFNGTMSISANKTIPMLY